MNGWGFFGHGINKSFINQVFGLIMSKQHKCILHKARSVASTAVSANVLQEMILDTPASAAVMVIEPYSAAAVQAARDALLVKINEEERNAGGDISAIERNGLAVLRQMTATLGVRYYAYTAAVIYEFTCLNFPSHDVV